MIHKPRFYPNFSGVNFKKDPHKMKTIAKIYDWISWKLFGGKKGIFRL